MNRSISVGDVLVVEDLSPATQGQILGVYACNPMGWGGLEYLPPYIPGANFTETSTSYERYCLLRHV